MIEKGSKYSMSHNLFESLENTEICTIIIAEMRKLETKIKCKKLKIIFVKASALFLENFALFLLR